MPVPDITNPEVMNFLAENYDKTAFLRFKWNELHKEKLVAAATLTHEKGYRESDVVAASVRAGLAALKRCHASNAVHRKQVFFNDSQTVSSIALRKGHSIADIGLGDPKEDPRLARPDTDLQTDPKMRPVEPEQKAILYKGIPSFGRKVYLNKRVRIPPEDKFYFPESSGWEYGWRLKDSPFGRPALPKFGRVMNKF